MYIFANFKAYLDFAETNILVSQLLQSEVFERASATVGLFPSALAFSEVEKALRGTDMYVGGQHIMAFEGGAATGEVNAEQLGDAGAKYVLVGHSERRRIMGETDDQVAEQFQAALAAGLIPVLCIGETADELAAGQTKDRLRAQLATVDTLPEDATYMVAYEPVWAITGSGSGKSCNREQAASMHQYIKDIVGEHVPVLYGGSVNSKNVVSYTSLPSIDGVLVGSASTKLESFEALVAAVNQ